MVVSQQEDLQMFAELVGGLLVKALSTVEADLGPMRTSVAVERAPLGHYFGVDAEAHG